MKTDLSPKLRSRYEPRDRTRKIRMLHVLRENHGYWRSHDVRQRELSREVRERPPATLKTSAGFS
jgi:hypothetical protein